MSWGIIKKSVNSTIGTEDFKPLDKIFLDGVDAVKGGVEDGRIVAKTAKEMSNEWTEIELKGSYTQYIHTAIADGVYLFRATVSNTVLSWLAYIGEHTSENVCGYNVSVVVATQSKSSIKITEKRTATTNVAISKLEAKRIV